MIKGYYKCECGKEFDNPQKFNGHKSHCQVHLKLFNKIEAREKLQIEFKQYGSIYIQKRKEDAIKRKKERLNKWIDEKHTCEKCGKVMTEKYGSGRFCSSSCSKSRQFTEELKERISTKLKKAREYKRDTKVKGKTIKKNIIQGQELAEDIGLKFSPYSEYNTAFFRKQVAGRNAYKFCLYDGNKLISSEIVLVYRYIVACKYGRKLSQNEIVHHLDGNKLNNDINNLEVLSRSEHNRLHAKENQNLKKYIEINGPWNKGLRNCYSEESIKR